MVRQKHIDWFRRGAGALRALARESGREDSLPTPEDWYLCPLCLGGLTIEELGTGELTFEQCNSRAGGKFDGPAHTQDRIRRLLSGQGDRPETATFAVDGFAARVEMRTTGQVGMIFTAVPQINNPADLDRA